MYHLGFIIEQALGHVTHGKNLQTNIPKDPEVRALWGFPRFETEGLAAKIPVYKSNWTIRAGWRTRRLLAEMNRNRLRANQCRRTCRMFRSGLTAKLWRSKGK